MLRSIRRTVSIALSTRLFIILGFLLISAGLLKLLESYRLRNLIAVLPTLFALQIFLNDFMELYLIEELKLRGNWFKIIIAPGTILHELSHFFAALFTGCTIVSVSLFKVNPKTGVMGYVEYLQPSDKWVVFRNFVIGFAPFLGCGMMVLGLYYLQAEGNVVSVSVVDVESAGGLFDSLVGVLSSFYGTLVSSGLSGVSFWLILYLQVCFGLGAASSTQDLKEFFYSLIRRPFSTIFIGVLSCGVILLAETSFDLMGYSVSEVIVYFLRAVVFVLLVSTSFLIVSLPLLFLGDKLLEVNVAGRAVVFFGSAAAYLSAYRLAGLSPQNTLVITAPVFLLLLVIFRYPNLFLKKR